MIQGKLVPGVSDRKGTMNYGQTKLHLDTIFKQVEVVTVVLDCLLEVN